MGESVAPGRPGISCGGRETGSPPDSTPAAGAGLPATAAAATPTSIGSLTARTSRLKSGLGGTEGRALELFLGVSSGSAGAGTLGASSGAGMGEWSRSGAATVSATTGVEVAGVAALVTDSGTAGAGSGVSLAQLDLSRNQLVVVQLGVLADLGSLASLNLSYNHLHTIIQARFPLQKTILL